MRNKKPYSIVLSFGTNDNIEMETHRITTRKLIKMIGTIIHYWQKENLTYLEIEIEKLEEGNDHM